MIDAEYEEVEGADGELDLSAEDSLPWLEAEEEDEDRGSDHTHIILLGLILFGILIAGVGTVWFFGSKADEATLAADGSVIEAPEGPIKERPEDPGGKEFAGTGAVAPKVAEGGTPEGVMNTDGNANAGGQGSGKGAGAFSGAASGASASSSSASGVGVQLAAYSSRARAEQGWNEISRRTDALSGLRYRIEEGVVDIGTVYRLQAVAGDRASANSLCAKLKSDGIDCQVKG
ncbi:SPOR domain-containing protein [Erythrobacter sp. SCSIO 43205]|nr:SPOR domain-containing protein [Erythrobacter sp. SCSIO 43205]